MLKNVESYKITRNGTEIYSSTNKTNDQSLVTGDKIEELVADTNFDGKVNIVDLAKIRKLSLNNI